MNAIDARDLGKRYRLASGAGRQDFWALRNASFQVPPGEVVGLIGGNGSGKSTLLKILSRVTHPDEGTLRLRGRVASLLEIGTGFHPDLDARQNIFLNGTILGMRRKEVASRLDQIVAFAGIEQFLDEPVNHFSTGMYLRLAFAVAAFLESDILLVDEVLAVGDAAFQEKCLGTMRDAARGGRTVLFVSHAMAAVSQLTRRALVLDAGKISFDGPTLDAIRHYLDDTLAHASLTRRPVEEISVRRRYRRGDDVFIAEMGFAADQAPEISVDGGMRLDFQIHARIPLRGLRIGYSVNAVGDQAMLTGLSPLFDVHPGAQLVTLQIDRLPLAPGDYDLSINLGAGGWSDLKLEYDAFMGFGRLRVLPQGDDGQPFHKSHREWGYVIHRSSSLQVQPCA